MEKSKKVVKKIVRREEAPAEKKSSLLEKYSAFQPDKKRVEKFKKDLEGGKGSSDFIKLKEGETRIRLLPPRDPELDRTFVKSSKHYAEMEGEKGKMHPSILCKGSASKGCVGCQIIQFLEETGDSDYQEIAKRMSASSNFYFGVYDRESEKVGILRASQTLASKIINPLSESNVFHPIKGRDFIVVKKTGKRFTEYDDSHYSFDPSPIISPSIKKGMDDDDRKKALRKAEKQIEEILSEIPDLTKFEKPDSQEAIDKFLLAIKELGIYDDFLRYQKRKKMDKKEQSASNSLSEEDIQDLEEYEEEEEETTDLEEFEDVEESFEEEEEVDDFEEEEVDNED